MVDYMQKARETLTDNGMTAQETLATTLEALDKARAEADDMRATSIKNARERNKAEAERDALRDELRKCHDVLRRLRDFDGWDGTYHAGHALDARNDGRAILDASLARHGLAVKEVSRHD